MSAPRPTDGDGPAGAATAPGGSRALLPAEEEGLFERARLLWQTGDWPALAALDRRPLADHPDRARLALLAAAGAAQTGDLAAARRQAQRALDWGCARGLVARVLVAGLYNSLGRVASLIGDEDRAAGYFDSAVTLAMPGHEGTALGQTRNIREKARLGLLPEAARLMGDALEAQTADHGFTEAQRRIFASQIRLIQYEMTLLQKRGRMRPAGRGREGLESRSTSQIGQDLWVLERTGYKRGGFFVEFGATDGVRLSNSYLLETEFGWSGICAEPNPDYFAELKRNRACTVSPDCILGESGREVEFILADEFGGVADFAGADLHSPRREAYRRDGRTIRVTSISLDAFLEKHGAPRRIDYLSIDTEGSELDILTPFPFDKWDIRLITVEHNKSADREPIRALLERHGYRGTEAQFEDWYERMPDGGDAADTATGPGTGAAAG